MATREAVKSAIYAPSDVEKIKDDDVYVLNPLFRLRNEHDYVQLCGWEMPDTYVSVSHAVGITLSLFDGRRTIQDIARMVRPFVKSPHAEDAQAKALWHVKTLACHYRRSETERRGRPVGGPASRAPSTALLTTPSLLEQFPKIPRPHYQPAAFLPKNAFAAHRDPAGGRKLRAPISMVWHLTAQCQTNCRYCYLSRRTDAEPLSEERAGALIQEAHALGVFYFFLGGGDVILCPHLIGTLEQLAQLEFLPVILATKAQVSREMAARLAETNIVYEIQFSIDSTVEDIADWLVRAPGFCRRTLESIDNALAAGLRVVAKSVITPYNILTIPRLYRELRKRGVAEVRLATYNRTGYHHSDDLFNHLESFEWLTHALDRLQQEFPDDAVGVQNGTPALEPASKEQRAARWPGRAACSAGRATMMICVDGKVIPCEQMPETEANFCGDLNEQSLEEIWHSEKLARRTSALPREAFEGTPCFECADRTECHIVKGFCIRDSAVYYGSLYVPERNCPKIELPFIRML